MASAMPNELREWLEDTANFVTLPPRKDARFKRIVAGIIIRDKYTLSGIAFGTLLVNVWLVLAGAPPGDYDLEWKRVAVYEYIGLAYRRGSINDAED